MKNLAVLAVVLLFPGMLIGQACSSYSYNVGPFPYVAQDLQGHKTGAHILAIEHHGSCVYGNVNKDYCAVLSSADSDVSLGETGVLTNPLYIHQKQTDTKGGSWYGLSGSAALSDTEAGGGVAQCGITGCTYGISISGKGDGGGFTLSTSGAASLWVNKHDFANLCFPEQYNPPTCDPGYPTPGVDVTALPKCSRSPIIVDTTGQGFKMSNPEQQYVTFDLEGNGKYQKVSWPLPNSGNAWLVNISTSGVIVSGLQLFGNYTAQPATSLPGDKNGFRALAVYDQVHNGGNYDLVLDKKDSIWPHLRLWIDTHCQASRDLPCHSLPGELYTLESKGITSIGLVYQGSNRRDAWGNAFRYSSVLNPSTPDRQVSADKRGIYDVWLVGKKP